MSNFKNLACVLGVVGSGALGYASYLITERDEKDKALYRKAETDIWKAADANHSGILEEEEIIALGRSLNLISGPEARPISVHELKLKIEEELPRIVRRYAKF